MWRTSSDLAFVPVKVDREERPDIDEFCMAACQTLTGSGGWPLNCLLMPDGSPFYAFTYLPREPRNGTPGLIELLENIAYLWKHKKDAVERNARSLTDALAQQQTPVQPDNILPDFNRLAAGGTAVLARIFDNQYKGFGNAPKFPMAPYLIFLMGSENPDDRRMAFESLKAIRKGGIWDHLAGGIHRYSTDRRWFAPHFEKMLYDQAVMLYAYTEAYSVSGDSEFIEAADSIIEFTMREMRSPEGGFYSAIDADSEGEEGVCYLWGYSELQELLGDDAAVFADFYGATGSGNFEGSGRNILHQALSIKEVSKRYGLAITATETLLTSARERLLALRNKRVQPLLDRKIIAGWNGLMLAALAKYASIKSEKSIINEALRTKLFISGTMISAKGRLQRIYSNKQSDLPGFLEDYSYLTWGLLELFKATEDPALLLEAESLALETIRLFQLPDGRLTISGNDFEQLPMPLAGLHDGVIPSGISVFASNLMKLAQETGKEIWRKEAEKTVLCYKKSMINNPSASLFLLKTCQTPSEQQKCL